MLRTACLISLPLFFAGCANKEPVVDTVGVEGEPGQVVEVEESGFPLASKQLSYIKGLEFGKVLKLQGFDSKPLDLVEVMRGVEDYLKNNKLSYSEKDLSKILVGVRANLQVEGNAIVQGLESKNKRRIDQFLKDIKDENNVLSTKEGLKYRALEAGQGKEVVTKTSIVEINIRSLLESGNIFYTSYYGLEPDFLDMPLTTAVAKIPLEVFQEVITNMKVGDRWMVHIPSERAYGKEGAKGAVPPDSNVILEVQLVSVNNP